MPRPVAGWSATTPGGRTAVLYGGWQAGTDIPMSRPTPTLAETPGITGRILYLVGKDDALIDAGQREQIRAALASAGVRHELVSYPGVGHAFFWPGTPPYDATARADAKGRHCNVRACMWWACCCIPNGIAAGRWPRCSTGPISAASRFSASPT